MSRKLQKYKNGGGSLSRSRSMRYRRPRERKPWPWDGMRSCPCEKSSYPSVSVATQWPTSEISEPTITVTVEVFRQRTLHKIHSDILIGSYKEDLEALLNMSINKSKNLTQYLPFLDLMGFLA